MAKWVNALSIILWALKITPSFTIETLFTLSFDTSNFVSWIRITQPKDLVMTAEDITKWEKLNTKAMEIVHNQLKELHIKTSNRRRPKGECLSTIIETPIKNTLGLTI